MGGRSSGEVVVRFQDQRTHMGAIESKLGSLASVMGSTNVALQGYTPLGSYGDLIDGKPLLDVVKTFNLQLEVVQSRIQYQAVRMGVSHLSPVMTHTDGRALI
jgi:hypothetical protein